jgi:hypothetical protein
MMSSLYGGDELQNSHQQPEVNFELSDDRLILAQLTADT